MIDYEKLMNIRIPDVVQTYTERDTILYALSLGYGADPLDENALRYCYEKDIRTAPTIPLVLSHPGFWMRELETGIDWRKIVHGEQRLVLHRPAPVAGSVTGKTRVVDIVDRGADRGAIVTFDRDLYDNLTGDLVATMSQVNFCRGDGGFGGPSRESVKPPTAPEGSPDFVDDQATRPEAALLYRLSADPNPLHADPAAARAAGFPRPILHGLATFGIVGHSVLKAACAYDSGKIRALAGRFSSPVFPGDTIRTEIWKAGNGLRFRSLAVERNVTVMTAGDVELQ